MEHGDAAVGAQRAQRILELARFLHRLVDERLDDRLAERRQLTAAKAAEEALHPGKADTVDLVRLLVEHDHPGAVEDLAHDFRLPAFVIVVAKHAEHGDGARLDVLGEDFRLARAAEIGEVAAQQQDVGMAGNLAEQLAVRRFVVLLNMKVTDRRHPHRTVTRHIVLRDCRPRRRSPIGRRRSHSRAGRRCGRGRLCGPVP